MPIKSPMKQQGHLDIMFRKNIIKYSKIHLFTFEKYCKSVSFKHLVKHFNSNVNPKITDIYSQLPQAFMHLCICRLVLALAVIALNHW